MELLFGLCLIAAVAFAIGFFKLKGQREEVRTINRELEKKEQEQKKSIDDLVNSHHQFSQSVVVLQQQKQQMEEAQTKDAQQRQSQVKQMVEQFEVTERQKIERILEKIAEQSEIDIYELLNRYDKYEEYVKKKEQEIVEGLKDAAAKYAATISTYRQQDQEEQKLTAYMIQLSENDREDIDFLIREVVPKIHNPQLQNKLIWTEYVMKPTGELLKRILPDKDCSGIYKITHAETKKSYIGRSTSVYKRLQEHIKSSLGVGTIADQWVHHEMRAQGIENFTFELVEECDKDKLSEREKHYISFFQTDVYGYNRNVGG